MKRYDKYKDSGISWIGEIPEHWDSIRLKFIGLTVGGLTYSPQDITDEQDGILVLRSSNIKDEKLILDDNVYVKREVAKKCLIRKGDILICSRNGSADLVGKSAKIDRDICASYGAFMMVYRPSKNININYAHYLVQVCINKYKATFKTSTINQLTNTLFSNIFTPFVSEPIEQKGIAKYLDEKNILVDKYIEIKQKEITALDELKQSIIAKTVTKGLDKNVAMKDSDIAWIGKVPKHWKIHKVKEHFTERKEKVSDKDFPPLSVSKMGVVPQLDDACKTDNGDNRKLVCKGDYVVNSRSDRKGSCGVSPFTGSVSLINIVLSPFNINPSYIHYMFRSNNFIEEFYRYGRGIVADLWTTRYSEMRNISIPIPPLSEQEAIVTYINSKCEKIDKMKSSIESQITALKEYKQRLISDVVTGKRKVTSEN